MEKFYFIDESGDADFFGKRGKELWKIDGWNPLLIMGLLETNNRKQLRKDVIQFHAELLNDPYYGGIHSLNKGNHFFHARSDHPEVRAAFFQFLRRRNDFNCFFVVRYKDPQVFINEFQKNTAKFYFHVVKQLIDLPKFSHTNHHQFYLSRRNKTTNDRFNQVLEDALCKEMYTERLNYQAEIVKSAEYPELWIIDYMLWALQRCLLKKEKRFLNALSDKVSIIQDNDGGEFKGSFETINITSKK